MLVMDQPLSEQHLGILKVLLKANPELRSALLKHADKNLVQLICECVLNVLKGNVKLSDIEKKKLAKHKLFFRKVVQKTKSWKRKRKIIQKGGNFLIPLLAPIIASLLSKLL